MAILSWRSIPFQGICRTEALFWKMSSVDGHFEAVSRTKFAGVVIAPGHDFEFSFGSFTVPPAPIGSTSRSDVVDLRISFTDTIMGTLLNAGNAEFYLPTNLNPTLIFRIAAESAASELTFCPARVIETVAGELISGPVAGKPLSNSFGILIDTSISSGKPGVGMGSSFPKTNIDSGNVD
jgi:hypothetical protein